mmetsp:Transcript_55050/g.178260  ORF Transcript_55050/g.178260 Transcript_55050/m.178260 type:complete len:479 (-) Transcript_55050:1484-2920(-)
MLPRITGGSDGAGTCFWTQSSPSSSKKAASLVSSMVSCVWGCSKETSTSSMDLRGAEPTRSATLSIALSSSCELRMVRARPPQAPRPVSASGLAHQRNAASPCGTCSMAPRASWGASRASMGGLWSNGTKSVPARLRQEVPCSPGGSLMMAAAVSNRANASAAPWIKLPGRATVKAMRAPAARATASNLSRPGRRSSGPSGARTIEASRVTAPSRIRPGGHQDSSKRSIVSNLSSSFLCVAKTPLREKIGKKPPRDPSAQRMGPSTAALSSLWHSAPTTCWLERSMSKRARVAAQSRVRRSVSSEEVDSSAATWSNAHKYAKTSANVDIRQICAEAFAAGVSNSTVPRCTARPRFAAPSPTLCFSNPAAIRTTPSTAFTFCPRPRLVKCSAFAASRSKVAAASSKRCSGHWGEARTWSRKPSSASKPPKSPEGLASKPPTQARSTAPPPKGTCIARPAPQPSPSTPSAARASSLSRSA